MESTQNLRIATTRTLTPPREMKHVLPMSDQANATVVKGRQEVIDILSGTDPRLLVVVGPCSVHDEKLAYDYAERLAELSRKISDQIVIVMRVYFEKPRTTIGWKGLISDPELDGTFNVEGGLRLARRILLKINEMGLPAGSEMLDPISPQYTADLISWASIGARTTESQTHRMMASGLSMPVGFKNGTDGGLDIALNAMESARNSHSFIGINEAGITSVIKTSGNSDAHLILRGGNKGPNFEAAFVNSAVEELEKNNLPPRLLVDCSHANSLKDHRRQHIAFEDVLGQRISGNKNIIGVMIESNIGEGNQKLQSDISAMNYGVSITDACINWEETERLLLDAHQKLSAK